MKKILLMLLCLVASLGAWAQGANPDTWDNEDVNVAQGVPVFISARWDGEKANAVDNVVNANKIQLQVTDAQPTEWLVLDLGANFDVTKFSLSTTGDRKDKQFAICTAAAQSPAPVFADGTDALDDVWTNQGTFDDNYENTGLTTLTYSVDWKNVRYIKYMAIERNHDDQYGTSICEFRVKGTTEDNTLATPHHINILSVPEVYAGQNGYITLAVCNSINATLPIDQEQLSATSSAEAIATVTRDGERIRVNGVSEGQATITINYGSLQVQQDITILQAMTVPDAPTRAADDVLALWCDNASYTKVGGYGWFDWGGCTTSTMDINGNKIEQAKGFKYLGSQFNSTDVSGYDYIHVDFYPTAATTIGIIPITTKAEGGNNPERGVTTSELTANQWTSVDIALSEFTNNGVLGLDRLYQIKYIKQITPAGAETNADGSFDLFVDNIYFWKAPSDAPKQVSATVNDPAMGTAVVKQNDVVVTEAAIGSDVDFYAEANDGYLFLGWYRGEDLVSTANPYTVEDIQANTTLQAKFRALGNVYHHKELTNSAGDKRIYLTMKRVAENQYQVVIDSEEEMRGFSNAYIGSINGGSQIKLNDEDVKAQYVTLSANKHRLTINVPSTTPIKWNTPIYINMPGEVTFNQPVNPQGQTIEYDMPYEEVVVTSLAMSQAAVTIDVEDVLALSAIATPIYADNQTLTWTSSHPEVASVMDGVVTGLAEGTTTITATIGSINASCEITVALDPSIPHAAAPTVVATGKEIRAIYSDDVELALANEFSINTYGNAPYQKKSVDGNNYIICTAEGGNTVMSWGRESGQPTAFVAKDEFNDGEHAGLDASGMTYLHLDIWANTAVSGIHIQNDNTILQVLNHDGNGWQGFDIDITSKASTLNNISIFKFAGLPTTTKVAFDNVYFWKSAAPTATISIAAACTDGETCYSTYSNANAFVVPEGLTVSTVGVDSEGKLVVNSYNTGDVVAANTGVMVSGTAGDHNIALTNAAATEAPGTNNLHPSSEAMTGDNLFYRLTMHNGETIGFWWGAADGAAFSLAANKAYLAVPTSVVGSSNLRLWFGDETVTGIEGVEASTNDVIYNLQGQRVNRVQKGVNIINGKKVIR